MYLLSIFISLFISITSLVVSDKAEYLAFDKKQFYAVFASSDLNKVNAEIKILQSNPSQSAYLGALLMKKAGIVGNPKDKLSLFKDGRIKLENAIKNNPSVVEYLFLRYMIQENAPSFIGYNTNLEEDKKKIISHYNTFEPVVQEALQNYSKTSKSLSSTQF